MEISDPIVLLDSVESLGLLSDSQAVTLRANWAASQTMTAAEAAESLVQQKLVTEYQAQRLLGGDGQSLVITGRYQIRELLGVGGMGTVFLATDRQLGRSVALKVLPPQLVSDAGAVARFEREAKAMARLAHPNIVQAHDAGADGGQHYLVMEHVEGIDLRHILKKSGALQSAVAADYAYQAAVGLQHAHEKGLIHRDLKPANLIITPNGQVKILDLGLARFIQDQIEDETLTMEGAVLGTPDYMAPEQFGRARHADERSDVYSLGCTLYHMLSGRVPFPGSSFSEKHAAHQKTDPEPVHQSASGISTGLSQAVVKMMAKRAADRFQSARECAEALLPYVEASSGSLPNIQATTDWQGSQFRINTSQVRRRNVKWTAIGGAMIVVSLVLGFGASQLRDLLGIATGSSNIQRVEGGSTVTGDAAASERDQSPQSTVVDPWFQTVSKNASDGGKFRSINAALEDVKSGMTIRVLDEGPYREQIFLDERHRGITIETTVNTILELTDIKELIRLDRTSDVSIRGFRLRASDIIARGIESQRGQPAVLVSINGDCSGLTLDQLEMDATRTGSYIGVLLEGACSSSQAAPIVIRRCKVRRAFLAIAMNGNIGHIQRLVIRDNVFEAASNQGIDVMGSVSGIQIVGNQFIFSTGVALGIANLDEISENILIANNTFLGNVIGLGVSDDAPAGQNIHVRNNIFLDSKTCDMTFIDGMKAKPGTPLQARDGKLLQTSWHIGENWREVVLPLGASVFDQGWIPATETDVRKDKIDGINRDPKDNDNFLRPAKDSELAQAGAGNTEPSLPRYVGALPPRGVERWDWTRTWQALPGTSALLTVSRDAKDGGQYRTIKDALEAAKPWSTIRVLDSGSYEESIIFSDSTRFLGVMLESHAGATLVLSGAMSESILIENAQHVRVHGFRFRDSKPAFGLPFIKVSGECANVVLDGLTFTNDPKSAINGVVLDRVRPATPDVSVIIRRCRFDMSTPNEGTARSGCGAAILLMGSLQTNELTPGNILIADNRISGTLRGIHLQHSSQNVLIAGNIIWNGVQECIGFEDWGTESANVVAVNNTLSSCPWLVRVWDNAPAETLSTGLMEIRNNILFDARITDIGHCYMLANAHATGAYSSGDVQALLRNWRFVGNYRDGSGTNPVGRVPSDNDHSFDLKNFVSRSPADDAFMRPRSDSQVAIGGSGACPAYAGAVPPEDVEPWDWEITWRTRRLVISEIKDASADQNRVP